MGYSYLTDRKLSFLNPKRSYIVKKLIIVSVCAILSACGGGGGGGSSSPASTAAAPPAPSITFTSNVSKVKSGAQATLTWTSTNTSSCTASNGWAGTQAISGTVNESPTSNTAYTLTCTGAGGSVNQTVNIAVPIPAQKTSYLNAKNINIDQQALPVVDPTFYEQIQNGYAFADFFQDGTMSLVAFTDNTPSDGTAPTTPGKVHIFNKNSAGVWQDKTSTMIDTNVGCITPRKVIVADFNNDGIPDVFVACHGYDAAPYPGESPHILLSQPNGTFKNITLPINCFCHGATAADLNADGNIDIVVADMRGQGGKTPLYALMGDGKGNFTIDYNRVDRPEFEYANAFWSVELVQGANGNFNLLAGGTVSTSSSTVTDTSQMIYGDANGNFVNTQVMKLPTISNYEGVMDFVVEGQYVYTLRVLTTPSYGGVAIQKIDTTTGTATTIYTHTGTYGNYLKFPGTWFSWMVPYNGNLISENGFYNVSVTE